MSLFEALSKQDGLQRDTTEAWGETLYLRTLNADEMIDYAADEDSPESKRVRGVQLLVASLAEGSVDGPRIPREDQPKFVKLLVTKDFRTLQRVTRLARELNGMTLGPTATQATVKND